MRAVVKPAIGKIELVDVPIPEPGPDDIIVKTALSTICGTDMHFLDEIPTEVIANLYPSGVTPQGLLMGHEGVGTVHEVGSNVTRLRPGDRVIASGFAGCGKCHECQAVDPAVCTGGGTLMFGCQSEYYRVPFGETNLAVVPESVTNEQAIFATDIMSTAFGAVERANAGFGDSVAIFAQGPLGLCATAAARARGCGFVIGIDALPDRLEMSKRMGANVTINAKETDPQAKIMELTGNQGVDVAIEAVGTQAAFQSCTQVVRRGGTVSSIGVYGMTPMLSMPTFAPSFYHRQIVMTLCPSGRDRMERMLEVIEHGGVDFTPLITHQMKLDDIQKAYELFRSKAEGVLKIAIRP